jgi:hypothetical protein
MLPDEADAEDDREHAETVDAWEMQQIRKGGSRQLSEREGLGHLRRSPPSSIAVDDLCLGMQSD